MAALTARGEQYLAGQVVSEGGTGKSESQLFRPSCSGDPPTCVPDIPAFSTGLSRGVPAGRELLPEGLSPCFRLALHRPFHRLSTVSEERAVIAQDRAGGVVAGGAGDAAAGMGAGAAMIEAS